jgi:hypothetical protein
MWYTMFVKSLLLITALVVGAWTVSVTVWAADEPMGSGSPQQKEISKETIKQDRTDEGAKSQREASPAGELGKGSEQQLSVPEGTGPDAHDVEMTRDQDYASSISF